MNTKARQPMDAKQIDKIRQRCEKATPGPWDYDLGDHSIYSMDMSRTGEYEFVTTLYEEKSIRNEADAEFISKARQDIPALLDYITELEEWKEIVGGEIRYRRKEMEGDEIL